MFEVMVTYTAPIKNPIVPTNYGAFSAIIATFPVSTKLLPTTNFAFESLAPMLTLCCQSTYFTSYLFRGYQVWVLAFWRFTLNELNLAVGDSFGLGMLCWLFAAGNSSLLK
jgi:hypothetical protein